MARNENLKYAAEIRNNARMHGRDAEDAVDLDEKLACYEAMRKSDELADNLERWAK